MYAYCHGLGHETVQLLRKGLLKDESCCFMDGNGTSYGLWMIRMKVVVKDGSGFLRMKVVNTPLARYCSGGGSKSLAY